VRVFRPPAALAVALLALTLLEPGGGGAALAARRPRPQVGLASYYAHEWHGHRTASGERYDMRAMTAAHRTLPFGTRVRVQNLANGRVVAVRINDRGPFRKDRIIDLSYGAALKLGIVGPGVARVKIRVLKLGRG